MTKKADFNAEEWSTVVEGPLFAAMKVVAAERGGTLRESLAIGRSYRTAREEAGNDELLDAIVSSPPSLDPKRLQEGGGDLGSVTTERVRDAVRIVEQKADPAELDAYRQFVLRVAEAAAEAHKEGGFLGVGGKQVSEKEQAALDEIAATLGTGSAG